MQRRLLLIAVRAPEHVMLGNPRLPTDQPVVVRRVPGEINPPAVVGRPREDVQVPRHVARARVDDVQAPVAVEVEHMREWAERGPVCGVEPARAAISGEERGVEQRLRIVRVPGFDERARVSADEERRAGVGRVVADVVEVEVRVADVRYVLGCEPALR